MLATPIAPTDGRMAHHNGTYARRREHLNFSQHRLEL